MEGLEKGIPMVIARPVNWFGVVDCWICCWMELSCCCSWLKVECWGWLVGKFLIELSWFWIEDSCCCRRLVDEGLVNEEVFWLAY